MISNMIKFFTAVTLLLLFEYGMSSPSIKSDPFSRFINNAEVHLTLLHFNIKHRSASSIARAIHALHNVWFTKKRSLQLFADDTTNSLWVSAPPTQHSALTHFVASLDKQRKQLQVHVKIITVDTQAMQKLGVNWQSLGNTVQANQHALNPTNNNSVLHWHHVDHLLRQIDAMVTRGYGAVIASPTLRMADQQQSMIESGEEVPYYERNHDGDATATFKNATLKLVITPKLMDAQRVSLNIDLQQDKISDLSVAGMPAIRTEKVQSSVVMHNHQTMVLGGMFTHHVERADSHVPLLSSIPVLGKIFTHQRWFWKREELLVIVTPSW